MSLRTLCLTFAALVVFVNAGYSESDYKHVMAEHLANSEDHSLRSSSRSSGRSYSYHGYYAYKSYYWSYYHASYYGYYSHSSQCDK